VNHADGVDEAADAVGHADRVAAIQRVAELLQRVQVLHVVLRLVRRVRQTVVLMVPRLCTATTRNWRNVHSSRMMLSSQRSAIARVHPVHVINTDSAPSGHQPSDQAN